MPKQISLLDYYNPAAENLDEWKKKCLQCNNCALRSGARQVVFGEGNSSASIMLVGEAPGAEEDRLGRPFVGKAGQLLDRILSACNSSREEVYIANIIKCRPTDNRVPSKEEISLCLPLLEKQIEIIDPETIVCLGSTAAKALISPDILITRERGQWKKVGGRSVMPTFHPAALLRDPRKKRPTWEDFKFVFKID